MGLLKKIKKAAKKTTKAAVLVGKAGNQLVKYAPYLPSPADAIAMTSGTAIGEVTDDVIKVSTKISQQEKPRVSFTSNAPANNSSKSKGLIDSIMEIFGF